MSWVKYEAEHPFPIQNLPYGAFRVEEGGAHLCTRIGDHIVDLKALSEAKFFDSIPGVSAAFLQPTLNDFMALGAPVWRATRETLTNLFSENEGSLRDDTSLKSVVLRNVSDVQMVLPAKIGDYTDFYASEEHATNLGKMFRPNAAPLLPNWKHIPIGYHGRASSIVVSGTPLRRPNGQTVAAEGQPPQFGPSTRVDFEIEMGAYIGGPDNALGQPLTIQEACERLFGLTVFNDWSARDIQKWEYVPLGPFLGKSFGSTVSPWIVTMEALKPFMVEGKPQDPTPLPYLQAPAGSKMAFNVDIACEVIPQGKSAAVVARTNMKNLYWSLAQMLTHHASNGCNMRAGDVIATGTISGTEDGSFGSMLELAWMGTKPVQVGDGGERKFIADGDVVRMRAEARGDGYVVR